MEEARQKNSQDLAKTLEMLEEWKKLWKKKIIQTYNYIFFHFPKKYWKNGRSQAKKFTRLGKNSENVGRMEEAVEEEIIQSYENIFFHFPKNIGRMEEARQKNSQDLAKTL